MVCRYSVCNISNCKSVPLVEHNIDGMISTVSTCDNGHITFNTEENVLVLYLHLACAVMIYLLVHCHKGVHLCQQTHINVEIIPPKSIILGNSFNFFLKWVQ